MDSGIIITAISERHDRTIGQVHVPIRSCLRTRLFWILPHQARIVVEQQGLLIGLLFELPDGTRQWCAAEDIGIAQQIVYPGQVITLDQMRIRASGPQ